MTNEQREKRILAEALFEYVDAGGGVTIRRDGPRITFELDRLEVLEKIVGEARATPKS
jgi:hypothetical protein